MRTWVPALLCIAVSFSLPQLAATSGSEWIAANADALRGWAYLAIGAVYWTRQ